MKELTTIKEVLFNKFGYREFRNNQQAIIESILKKQDCFVLMPTGGGKSLCYQIPALIFNGVTIVISPLIALMKDQVDALRINGIDAAYLNSSLSSDQQSAILEKLKQGKLKLLYIAPERLFSNDESFIKYLSTLNVSLFAIDEAHCISEWGHDFRPEYLQVKSIKKYFPEVPIIALTATADAQTRKDILEKLKLDQPKVFVSSFNRANISYQVALKNNAKGQLFDFLDQHKNDSGIIYTLSRNSAETLAQDLSINGFQALAYHAGLPNHQRAENQSRFLKDEVKIMVATIAFGMGINKSNVRFVVHMDMPKNIEGYYQETGRAGRDGLPSKALLFYSMGDLVKLRKFLEIEGNQAQTNVLLNKLNKMGDFCKSNGCRRKFLLNYFGENFPDTCGNCDFCLSTHKKTDITTIAQKALSAVVRLRENYGINYLVDFLKGARSEKIKAEHKALKTYGVGKDLSKEEWQGYFNHLIQNNYLLQTSGTYPIVKLTSKSKDVLQGIEKVYYFKKIEKTEERIVTPEYESDLFDHLKRIRYRLAKEEEVPPYLIFSDATLVELSTYLPQNIEELTSIAGFGQVKVEKYGEKFLYAIRNYCKINNFSSRVKARNSGFVRKAAPVIKNSTKNESLSFFRQGKSISEIAKLRGLSVNTVESHLAEMVYLGNIQLTELVTTEKIEVIKSTFQKHGSERLAPIKEVLGDNYTYAEIKAVQYYLKRTNKFNSN